MDTKVVVFFHTHPENEMEMDIVLTHNWRATAINRLHENENYSPTEMDVCKIVCQYAYEYQGNNENDYRVDESHPVISVGDLVWVDNEPFFCSIDGWITMDNDDLKKWLEKEVRQRPFMFSDWKVK